MTARMAVVAFSAPYVPLLCPVDLDPNLKGISALHETEFEPSRAYVESFPHMNPSWTPSLLSMPFGPPFKKVEKAYILESKSLAILAKATANYAIWMITPPAPIGGFVLFIILIYCLMSLV